MNRIDILTETLRKENRSALVPFITAGDPDLETTKQLILSIQNAGADMLELGIPYSDPLADGPTIQAASQRALDHGIRLKQIFEMVASLKGKITIPLVFFTYYNPIYRYGIEKFVEEAARAGIDGFIVPDLPVEEIDPLEKALDQHQIYLIPLVAPTSTPRRIEKISKRAKSFIYLISVAGVTGARTQTSGKAKEVLQTLRSYSERPVMIGFGISNPDQVKEMARLGVQGVVVGSALINCIQKNAGSPQMLETVAQFIRDLKKPLLNKD